MLAKLDQVGAVTEFGEQRSAAIEQMNLTAEQITAAKNRLFELTEARCSEIRNGRGERSNRKT